MADRPFIVRLPGFRQERLATVVHGPTEPGMHKRTPEWMVSFSTLSEALLGGTPALQLGLGEKIVTGLMDKIKATSSVEKLSGFTELFGWFSEMSRYVEGDMSGCLLDMSGVHNSPLVLMIPSGTAAATLENAMYKGTVIRCIMVIRVGFIRGQLQLMQAILFQHCRITRFQQQLDRLIIHCTILSKTNLICVYNQKGNMTGVGVSNFELNTTDHQHVKASFGV